MWKRYKQNLEFVLATLLVIALVALYKQHKLLVVGKGYGKTSKNYFAID